LGERAETIEKTRRWYVYRNFKQKKIPRSCHIAGGLGSFEQENH
jgi:hypothetical protein